MNNLKVATIVGTRPELIKLSRIIFHLDKNFEHILIHTGQNYDYELNEVFFKELGIKKPNYYLSCSDSNSTYTIANIIKKSYDTLQKIKPDCILIYGDTNSCLSSFAAKKLKIPIFHMEAGNRSFDENIPEEINRRVIDHISDVNLVLTEHARRYLIKEGINQEYIFNTGSNMYEVLHYYRKNINNSKILPKLSLKKNNYFVVSLHREENVDNFFNLKEVIDTLNLISKTYKKKIIFSCHPRTQNRLKTNKLILDKSIQILKPLGFFDYIKLQINSFCVLSDSGTVTEESHILGFAAITIRRSHERPEGFDNGVLAMSGFLFERVAQSINICTKSKLKPNNNYDHNNHCVSNKVLKIIISYVDKVNRDIWKKTI